MLKSMIRANFVLFSLLALNLVLGLPKASSAAKVGTFTEVLGQVEQLKSGKPPPVLPKVQDEVNRQDEIHTKPLSRARVLFLDQSTLTIAPRTKLSIEEYLYDVQKAQRHVVLEVISGFFQEVVERVSKADQITIKTPTATVGIRGSTVFVGVDSQGNTLLAMLRGLATFTSTTTGGKADVRPGQCSSVIKGQDPSPPVVMSIETISHLQKLLEYGLPTDLIITPDAQKSIREAVTDMGEDITPPRVAPPGAGTPGFPGGGGGGGYVASPSS